MTSAGVKGLNLFSSATLSASSSSKVEQTESFDDTFKSMKVEKSTSNESAERADTTSRDSVKVDEMTSTKTRNPVKTEDEVTDEQMTAMSDEIIGQVKQAIMGELDVTEEQLNAAIGELGLTEESLLNPSDLSQLVMKLEGIESQADMLTNPDFARNLKNILSAMEQIKENVTVDTMDFENAVADVTDDIAQDATVDDELQLNQTQEADESATAKEQQPETLVPEVTADANASTDGNTNMQSGTDGEGSDGLLQHKESKDAVTSSDVVNENQLMTAQDFAARLTEDLTEKVGATKANDIVQQVIDQAQVQVKQGVTSMEMQLYPEHLGKVLIQVTTHDGQVTAQITAESEAAKNALEGQLTLLKENLNNQGLKIENVEVTIASHAFEQNMQGERGSEEQTSQNRRTRRNIGDFVGDGNDEISEVEQEKIMEITGSTVSYSA